MTLQYTPGWPDDGPAAVILDSGVIRDLDTIERTFGRLDHVYTAEGLRCRARTGVVSMTAICALTAVALEGWHVVVRAHNSDVVHIGITETMR